MAARPTAMRGANIFDETKPMWQTFLVFLIPLMISNILQSAAQTFNSIFIGRLIGVNALAAISAVFPVIFMLFAFLIGISSGSTILIGQAYGAGDEHRVKKIAGTILSATLMFSIGVAIVGTLFAPHMLVFLGTPRVILPDSIAYTRFIFLSAPVLFGFLMYTSFLRGVGDSRTPLVFLISSTLLGLVLTPAFILGWLGLPRLGVISAAVAGTISTALALVALLIVLYRRRSPLRADSETLIDMVRVDWALLWSAIRIGIPTGLQTIMVSLAELAIISFVNHYGPRATAAYGAVNQIVGYVQFPALSISIAASIFAAQCIGARRPQMIPSVVRSAIGLNYVVGGILVGLAYALAFPLLRLFINDEQTVAIAHTLLMMTLWSYLIFGNSASLSGTMRGSGAVLVPTINGVLGIWLVEVPVSYLGMRHFGLPGVWLGYPAYYCVVVCAQYVYYSLFWKKREHVPIR